MAKIVEQSGILRVKYGLNVSSSEIILELDQAPWGENTKLELTLRNTPSPYLPLDSRTILNYKQVAIIQRLNSRLLKLTDIGEVTESLKRLGIKPDSPNSQLLQTVSDAFMPDGSFGGSSIGIEGRKVTALYNPDHLPYWVQLLVARADPSTYVDAVCEAVKYTSFLLADAVRGALGMPYVQLTEDSSIIRIKQTGRLV